MDSIINSFFAATANFFSHQGRYLFFALSILLFVFYSHSESIVTGFSTVLISTASPFRGAVNKMPDGKIKLKQAEPYSVAETPINIRENSYYLVIVDQESQEGFRFDFFGGSDYDRPEQERYVSPDSRKAIFSIFSGQSPRDVLFRIHFAGHYDVILHDLRVVEAPSWYGYRDYILFSGFGLLLLSLGMALHERSNREALILFAIVFFTYAVVANAPSDAQGGDNMWYFPVADSLLRDGVVALDHFKQRIQEVRGYAIVETPFGSVNYFPVGPSLLALPFLFFGQMLGQDINRIAEFTAKVFAAGTVVIIYLIALQFSLHRRYATLLALIFAFATTHFPIHAGGYWSHNCSGFLAALLMLVALRISKDSQNECLKHDLNKKYPFLLAIIIVLGYICRPDFSLWAITIIFFIAFQSIHVALLTGLYSLLLCMVFFIWSTGVYGTLLPPYFAASRISEPNFGIMLKQLFSPNRGLLIYNPIFIPFIFSLYYSFTDFRKNWIFLLINLYAALSLILISGFVHWWAGWSFGPRIYASLFPIFAILLIPFFLRMQEQPARWKDGLLSLLVLTSLLINAPGAFDHSAANWNSTPKNVDEYPERASDWQDLQFMRFYENLWRSWR